MNQHSFVSTLADGLEISQHQSMPARDAVDENELIIIDACCCCNDTLYCQSDCIGCSGESEFLCYKEKCCCKPGVDIYTCCPAKDDDKMLCQLGLICVACGFKVPSTCCKFQQHLCCLVSNGAFPTDPEVPCMCASLGLTCYPKCGCCMKVGDVKKSGAPAIAEMQR